MRIPEVLVLLSLFAPLPVRAQDVESAGPAVEDLAWMAGRWAGQSEGGIYEEHWSSPAHGQMTGMFRRIEEGSVRFTELLAIETGPGGPVLMIRHFGPGLDPWEEEPIRFELVRLDGRQAFFEADEADGLTRLVYESSTPDRLTVVLEKPRDGETRRSEFRYRRID